VIDLALFYVLHHSDQSYFSPLPSPSPLLASYDATWLSRVTTPLLDTCYRSYLNDHLVESIWRDVLNRTLWRSRYNYNSMGHPTDAATEYPAATGRPNATWQYVYDDLGRVTEVVQDEVPVLILG